MKNRRFVVQEHETAEGVHWDLMLESASGGFLTTFRLEEPPEQALGHPVRAERIFDHPPRFLGYEGPVQKGTGRVHIVERGSWQLDEWRDDWLAFHLEGAILSGPFTLVRTSETDWRLARADAGRLR
ncbi:MAG TPA: DNA polymerase ligase N-terminal domain-containing protein [Sedimentisphaerales bacterium]|nr:DNA polymerase ligase N-terminal domain-containing protein [Sedimentisphaerales bacterium]HRS10026.1 DNA polymerase ligase N-terminal domain-containing protein [Sedimentisphaerales bacterium]HRV46732.1 DNA polymerase ligase N-terminal domain-containing protein [Sedimentisphaerales bacterium]